jgi:hypothetical protein
VPIDPKTLPKDPNTLQQMVLDLAEQLDRAFAEQHKYQDLLRELLDAQRNRKSEQLSKEQLELFEAAWQAEHPEEEAPPPKTPEMTTKAGPRSRSRTKSRGRSGADGNRWRNI